MSQSNQQKLTLYELIDLYSAFSKTASVEWKCWTAFSLYDTRGTGVLDKVDISRALKLMTTGTENTALVGNTGRAAQRMQQYFRGYKVRVAGGRFVISGVS